MSLSSTQVIFVTKPLTQTLIVIQAAPARQSSSTAPSSSRTRFTLALRPGWCCAVTLAARLANNPRVHRSSAAMLASRIQEKSD